MRSRISTHSALALAAVAVLGLAASSAVASDFCSPCVQPISVQSIAAPAPMYCSVCPSPALARTNLPGWYSDDYDYHTTAQHTTGITYAIPTMNGFIESDHIPLTNPVDQYYATHSIVNGQVVDDSAGAMASVSDQLKMDKLDDTVRTAQAQMEEAYRRMDTAQTQMDRANDTMQSAQTQVAQLDRNLEPTQGRVAQLDRNLRGVETSQTVRTQLNNANDSATASSQIAQANRNIQTGQTSQMVQDARTQSIQSMNAARDQLSQARQQLQITQKDLAQTIDQYRNVQKPVDVSMKETDDAWKDIMDRQDLTAVPQMTPAPLELPPAR